MKIAGRKNDGAWFRTNKAIHKLSTEDKASLESAFVEACLAKAETAYADMQSMAAEVGVTWPPEGAGTATLWLNKMCVDGIPRQVWKGRWTFTTYALVGGKMKANYQTSIHYFAKDMRRFMKYWLFGQRQVKDVFDIGAANTGNPGGQPDSDITT